MLDIAKYSAKFVTNVTASKIRVNEDTDQMLDKRLQDIFLELVQIDGSSGEEKGVKEYIQAFLSELGLKSSEDQAHQSVNGNSGNLTCRIGDGGEFVLLSHMDTARPTKELKAIVHEDRISSSGNTILGADNRAGIAAILYTIEKIRKQQLSSKNFTVAFTIREEVDLHGSQHLQLDDRVRMGFVLDSSYRPGKFIYQTFGAQGFEIRVIGKPAHSGISPEKGVSSIHAAASAIAALKLGRIDEETTANIGTIKGGSAVNVIPAETFLIGESRSLKPEKVEKVVANVRAEFEKACKDFGAQLEFTSEWHFKPYHVAKESATYRKVYDAISKVGLQPEPVISAGGSDANSLNAKGIPSVNIGIGAQNPHADEEFILLEDLQKTADIAYELVKT